VLCCAVSTGDWDAGGDGYENDFNFDAAAAGDAAVAAGLSPWAAAALGGSGADGLPAWMSAGDRGQAEALSYEELCRWGGMCDVPRGGGSLRQCQEASLKHTVARPV
jgi:hypothetical protein